MRLSMAADAWLRMWDINDSSESEKIRQLFLKYCGLELRAMVRILEDQIIISSIMFFEP